MLITSSNLAEYFREAVGTARERTRVTISDEAEAYVVHLLQEFARAENAFAGTEAGEEVTMVDLLSKAQDAAPPEAVRIYKRMGDASLYFTGFFTEAVERKAVSVDYYKTMGESAYRSVAGLTRAYAATSSALFHELSDRFAQLVDLLTVVSVQLAPDEPPSALSVLDLVERYRRTGRPELLEQLERLGVVLRPGVKDDDGLVH
jgi:hypothetical protein